MTKERSFPALPLFFLILGLLLLGAFGYLVFSSLGESRETAAFESDMHRVDELLAEGRSEEALDYLLHLKKLPSRGRDRLSYLKRLRTATLDHRRLDDYAAAALRASRDLPRSEELAAVAVLALIEAGHFTEAADYAGRGLAGEEYQDIRQEALLRAGRRPDGKDRDDLVLADLPFSRRYQDFLRGAEAAGSAKLFLDGALLLLGEGLVEEGARLFTGPPLKGTYPLAAARALYDAGDYAAALEELSFLAPEERLKPPVLGLEADLLLRLGRDKKAREYYRYLIDVAPDLSPAPYISSFYSARRQSEEEPEPGEGGIHFLEKALDIFPRDLGSLLALGKALAREGRLQEAGEVLRRGAPHHQDDGDLDLLLLLVDKSPGGGMAPDLWELRARYLDSPPIAEVLMGLLFSLMDQDGLAVLTGSPEPGFTARTYQALDLFRRGKISAAVEAFDDIAREFGHRPEALFNRGLVLSARGRYQEALETWQRLVEDPRLDRNTELVVRSRLWRAEVYQALGLFPQSQRELREILAVDENNIPARKKLRKLEGLGQS